MMSKKTMKILMVVAVFAMIITIGMTTVSAVDITSLTGSTPSNDSELANMGNKVIGAIQACGIVLAVVIVMVLGIKYMMGSAEDKSEYKKSMIPYLVGAACIFMGTTIATVVYNFMK